MLGYGAILVSLHNVYVHMDLDWGYGPFRLMLASPRYRRWHHANAQEAYGKNLANIFPSGTCCSAPTTLPGICKKPLVVDGMAEYDVVKLVLYPFRQWGGLVMCKLFGTRRREQTRERSEPHGNVGGIAPTKKAAALQCRGLVSLRIPKLTRVC